LETYACATGLKAVLNKKRKTIGIPKQGFIFKTFGVINLYEGVFGHLNGSRKIKTLFRT
jgi:hypothetical protein